MSDHPHGILSLLPPIVAITLAILTRRVVTSLLVGVVVGALVTRGGNVWLAAVDTITIHLWHALAQTENLQAFCFTLLMGAMIGVVHRSGGMRALVDSVSHLAFNRRRGQLGTWLLGMAVFFDDYANTLLLGGTMRPLTDRLKISREKLAYLVDSTAAPVAGMALISTWVAGEIKSISDGLERLPPDAGQDVTALGLFLASIPYRFYVIWALLFVPLVAWLGRDFGPMLAAERRAWRRRETSRAGAPGSQGHATADEPPPDAEGVNNPAARWYHAVVPIGLSVAAIAALIYVTGRLEVAADGRDDASLIDVLGEANPYLSLLLGAAIGLAAAVLMSAAAKLCSAGDVARAALRGGRGMLPVLAILWMAWSLSHITRSAPLPQHELKNNPGMTKVEQRRIVANYRLFTGEYVGGLLEVKQFRPLLPTIVFVLAAAVAFATGTSWGTMALLMPMVIELTYSALAGVRVSPDDPILLGTIGGVLAGAIFGDHCSPISDTTVLSAQASGCGLMEHVTTQLPYALSVGGVSILFGTLPVGFGAPAWLMLPLGVLAMAGLLLLFGRRAEDSSDGEQVDP